MSHFPSKVQVVQDQPASPSREELDAFITAVRGNDTKTADAMIAEQGKALIDARDNINAIAMTWLAFDGNVKMLTYLLDKGADIEGRGTDDRSPLGWAIYSGHFEATKLLLERGASVYAKDARGVTPLDEAGRYSSPAMKELVEKWPEVLKAREEEAERQRLEKLSDERNRALTEDALKKVKADPRINLKKKQPRP